MKSKIISSICLLLLLVTDGQAIDQWQQKANIPAIGRHRLNSFAINGKGYLGLGHINSVVNIALPDFWEYDPATDSWTQKADFGGGGRYHCLTFSVGGKGYAGAGRDESSQFNDFWEYDPTTNNWTQLNNYPGGDRIGPLAFVIDDVAYAGLGSGGNDDTQFYRYNANNDTWTTIATFPGQNRNTGVAFGLAGKGYVGTGWGAFGAGRDFWEYKPSADQWIQRASVGPTNREGATGFAVGDYGYILTGNDFGTGENFDDVWKFNPGSNTWTQLEDFPGSDRRFMTSFVIGERAYCASGTNGTNFNDLWEFNPNGEPVMRLAQRLHVNAFPNPAVDRVQFDLSEVDLPQKETLFLSITDVTGREIFQTNIKNQSVQFERGNELQNGVYFYQVYTNEAVLFADKIIFN